MQLCNTRVGRRHGTPTGGREMVAVILVVLAVLGSAGPAAADEDAPEDELLDQVTSVLPHPYQQHNDAPTLYRWYTSGIWHLDHGVNGAQMRLYSRPLTSHTGSGHVRLLCRNIAGDWAGPFALDNLWLVWNYRNPELWVEAGIVYDCGGDTTWPIDYSLRKAFSTQNWRPDPNDPEVTIVQMHITSLSLSENVIRQVQINRKAGTCDQWQVRLDGSVKKTWVNGGLANNGQCVTPSIVHMGLEANSEWGRDGYRDIYKKHNHLVALRVHNPANNAWEKPLRYTGFLRDWTPSGGHTMSTQDEIHTCYNVTETCH